MRKKYKLLIVLLLVVSIFMFFGVLLFKNKKDITVKENIITRNDDLLSMMLEQTIGAGDYVMTARKDWPKEGYVFNKLLSKCENGGKLTWDDTKNAIILNNNVSDKCYVYFDKVNTVVINNYSITTTDSSITITISASSADGTISTYYYSKDNGVTYVNSSSKTYTFSNLNTGTYIIKIYVKDSNNIESDKVVEDVIVLPKPTNPTIAFDNDYNVVLSGSTSKNGSVEYYYSFDNKTFKKGTTITVDSSSTIYAYAIDTLNQKSNVVNKNVIINNSTTGTVTSNYYCSHNNSYQSSSSCKNIYAAKATTELDCEEGKYDSTDDYCYITQGSFNDRSTCLQSCKNSAYSQGHTYYCPKDNNKYYCTIDVGQRKEITTYSCPNGGTLSDTTCTNTYSGSLKYKCGSTYYNDKASATRACTNYCSSGTYYNGKCYKMS